MALQDKDEGFSSIEEAKEWFGEDWPPKWFMIGNTKYNMHKDGDVMYTETKTQQEWIEEYSKKNLGKEQNN